MWWYIYVMISNACLANGLWPILTREPSSLTSLGLYLRWDSETK